MEFKIEKKKIVYNAKIERKVVNSFLSKRMVFVCESAAIDEFRSVASCVYFHSCFLSSMKLYMAKIQVCKRKESEINWHKLIKRNNRGFKSSHFTLVHWHSKRNNWSWAKDEWNHKIIAAHANDDDDSIDRIKWWFFSMVVYVLSKVPFNATAYANPRQNCVRVCVCLAKWVSASVQLNFHCRFLGWIYHSDDVEFYSIFVCLVSNVYLNATVSLTFLINNW